ncbi:hypothetical protein PBY51_004404 [Eleginops maclovinus]|uniref:Uncharacterized protein n=1 Tax=Eleginops maclovinus TaxID=56733 RepID=A0AAN7Y4G4_ELEMC|nr:hypothetical protein PBY51_004404 [Eleginops maclovinus]
MTRLAIIIHSKSYDEDKQNIDARLASAAGCAATWQSLVSFAACGQLVAAECLLVVLQRNGTLSPPPTEPGDNINYSPSEKAFTRARNTSDFIS